MWQAEEQRSGELERRTARSGPMRGQDVQPPRCEGEQLKEESVRAASRSLSTNRRSMQEFGPYDGTI